MGIAMSAHGPTQLKHARINRKSVQGTEVGSPQQAPAARRRCQLSDRETVICGPVREHRKRTVVLVDKADGALDDKLVRRAAVVFHAAAHAQVGGRLEAAGEAS